MVEGDTKIHPGDKFLATYKYWLENVKDWCISRQLGGDNVFLLGMAQRNYSNPGSPVHCIVEEVETKAREQYITYYTGKGYPLSQAQEAAYQLVHQDKDVLDTWFSSWLWPIEVFNGITNPGNADINYYYPTSVLVTGQDIIFFWVARMIMAGYAFKNEKPFSDVYFTGMVRDKQGRKMSKSLGNSPDLLELIGRYGADAVRFGIMIASPAGNDLLFDEAALEQGRNFNNKLWNALKLVSGWGERISEITSTEDGFAIEWFENHLNEAKKQIEGLFKDFKLSEALKLIYSLIWDDFCSWYLEWVKPGFEQQVEKKVYEKTVGFFEELLQLLHPFMPFITEEIFHLLKDQGGDLCVLQFGKDIHNPRKSISSKGDLLKQVISAIRDAKIKNQVKPKDAIELFIQTEHEETYHGIESILSRQLNAASLHFVSQPTESTIAIVCGKDKIYLKTEAPVNTQNQKQDLLKELDYLKGFLIPVEKKLSNTRFVENAKPEILALEQKKKADAEAKIKAIEESLANLS